LAVKTDRVHRLGKRQCRVLLPARLVLEINIGKLLFAVVAHDKAGGFLLDGPGRREAAFSRHPLARPISEGQFRPDYGVALVIRRFVRGAVMTQIGRLIRGILLFAGVVLATGGVLLLIEEFWVWLKTNDWSPLDMQTVWDAMNVSSPPALTTIMESPLWLVMFTIGLIFIWVATELHESLAKSLEAKKRSKL
jgi:hypothetical protein